MYVHLFSYLAAPIHPGV